MRYIYISFFIVVFVSLLAIGCEEGKGYDDTMVRALDKATKISYVTGAKQKIQMYRTENGHYPNSLDDMQGIPAVPDGWKWEYDPKTGKVDIVRK